MIIDEPSNNIESSPSKALVIFSGGQDSTTALYWAIKHFDTVTALTFDYGQRHQIELSAAKQITNLVNIAHLVIKIDFLKELDSALIQHNTKIVQRDEGLPNTFVPGRNILFLTIGSIYAHKNGITDIAIGVCQTDYSGYPDCRQEFIETMQTSLSSGMDTSFKIHTPLMNLTKTESVKLAQKMGAMEALALSRTCYEGVYPACGTCPACQLRLKGFEEAGVEDPIEYLNNKFK